MKNNLGMRSCPTEEVDHVTLALSSRVGVAVGEISRCSSAQPRSNFERTICDETAIKISLTSNPTCCGFVPGGRARRRASVD